MIFPNCHHAKVPTTSCYFPVATGLTSPNTLQIVSYDQIIFLNTYDQYIIFKIFSKTTSGIFKAKQLYKYEPNFR